LWTEKFCTIHPVNDVEIQAGDCNVRFLAHCNILLPTLPRDQTQFAFAECKGLRQIDVGDLLPVNNKHDNVGGTESLAAKGAGAEGLERIALDVLEVLDLVLGKAAGAVLDVHVGLLHVERDGHAAQLMLLRVQEVASENVAHKGRREDAGCVDLRVEEEALRVAEAVQMGKRALAAVLAHHNHVLLQQSQRAVAVLVVLRQDAPAHVLVGEEDDDVLLAVLDAGVRVQIADVVLLRQNRAVDDLLARVVVARQGFRAAPLRQLGVGDELDVVGALERDAVGCQGLRDLLVGDGVGVFDDGVLPEAREEQVLEEKAAAPRGVELDGGPTAADVADIGGPSVQARGRREQHERIGQLEDVAVVGVAEDEHGHAVDQGAQLVAVIAQFDQIVDREARTARGNRHLHRRGDGGTHDNVLVDVCVGKAGERLQHRREVVDGVVAGALHDVEPVDTGHLLVLLLEARGTLKGRVLEPAALHHDVLGHPAHDLPRVLLVLVELAHHVCHDHVLDGVLRLREVFGAGPRAEHETALLKIVALVGPQKVVVGGVPAEPQCRKDAARQLGLRQHRVLGQLQEALEFCVRRRHVHHKGQVDLEEAFVQRRRGHQLHKPVAEVVVVQIPAPRAAVAPGKAAAEHAKLRGAEHTREDVLDPVHDAHAAEYLQVLDAGEVLGGVEGVVQMQIAARQLVSVEFAIKGPQNAARPTVVQMDVLLLHVEDVFIHVDHQPVQIQQRKADLHVAQHSAVVAGVGRLVKQVDVVVRSVLVGLEVDFVQQVAEPARLLVLGAHPVHDVVDAVASGLDDTLVLVVSIVVIACFCALLCLLPVNHNV